MSFIPPSPETNIYLLHGVPLDNTYDHTIYFRTEQEQREYFSSLAKYQFTNQTFQRVNRNFIRVQAKIGDIYDCNYMMFQNHNQDHHSRKWFYAFVLSVNYINEGCCELEYELDVLQTWHFNYKLDHCFVERQHSLTDNIGDNILPEPVKTGEYVCNENLLSTPQERYTNLFADLSQLIIILGVIDLAEDEEVEVGATQGKIYDGIYGGLTLYWYKTNSTGIDLLNEKLSEYVQVPDNIVALYVVPQYLVGEAVATQDNSGVLSSGATGTEMSSTFGSVDNTTTIDGYLPDNKKLLTYPYNFYNVDNGNGNSLTLRYEFFANRTINLQFNGTVSQPCKLTVRPKNYKGVTGTLNTEILTLTDYPLCSWNMDAYKAWVAQNSLPFGAQAKNVAGAIGGILTYVAGLATGGTGLAIAGGMTALGSVVTQILQEYNASIQADISGGNFNSANVNLSAGKQQFFGGRFSINRQYAEMIDGFFTRFGYSVNSVAIPERYARTRWTYLKTGDCTITAYATDQTQSGGIPNDDSKKICEIYNDGITWWRYSDTMDLGNYSLPNNPL